MIDLKVIFKIYTFAINIWQNPHHFFKKTQK